MSVCSSHVIVSWEDAPQMLPDGEDCSEFQLTATYVMVDYNPNEDAHWDFPRYVLACTECGLGPISHDY